MKKLFTVYGMGLLFAMSFVRADNNSLPRQALKETPTLLYADQIAYNDLHKSIEAKGHVEIHKNGLSLTADRIVYSQLHHTIRAFGHVTLVDKEGNVLFFDQADLSDDLKEAFIRRIRMILSDDAKLTAFQAQHQKGTRSSFEKVVYSPCDVCRANPAYEPLWQIKAEDVVWDEEKEIIEYKDAWLEMKGVPLVYVPYLYHPAPNIKRKSGFLAPSLGGGGDLGAIIAAPYFWAIDKSKDLTITPMVVGSRPMLALAYRQRFARGKMDLGGSAVYDTRIAKDNSLGNQLPYKLRGHLKADALFNLDDQWRIGLQAERASDQTYLRKFNFLGGSTKSLLISRGFMEGFYGRNYISVEGYDFQGLREQDINARTPMVLPLVNAHLRSKPQWDNSVFTLTSHFSSAHRRIGADITKLSTTGGWVWPKIGKYGQKATTELKVRGDIYSFSDVQLQNASHPKSGTKARVFPSFSTMAEWPWINHQETTRWVIEPLAGVTFSPLMRQETLFPNEDSLGSELNDLNLFAPSRFAGLDRINGGSYLNWGLNLGAYTQAYGNGSFFFGQTYGLQKPTPFLEGTGFEKRLSDYVVRLKMDYADWLKVSMRGLLDRHSFTTQRQELTLDVGKPVAKAKITYVNLPKMAFDIKDNKTEQIDLHFSSQVTPTWSFDLNTARDLGRQGKALFHGVGATYTDECFTFRFSVTKNYFNDRDISPGMIFMFRLVFKNLGEVQQSKSL